MFKRGIIERQIELWLQQGVVDKATANTLRNDIQRKSDNGLSFSLFKVLAGFSTIAFCAAILLLIAANWDAIPRLGRVAGILSLIIGAFLGGALINRRAERSPGSFMARHAGFLEELCYAIGGASYVGGVSLVGQMYHLPGALDEAMLGFGLGLGLAGLAVRSRVLGLGAVFCMAYWYVNTNAPENLLSTDFAIFVITNGALMWLAVWRDDRMLRRSVYLGVFVGLSPFLFEVFEYLQAAYRVLPIAVRLLVWLSILALSSVVLWVERHAPQRLRGIVGLRQPRILTAFTVGTVALLALYAELDRGFLLYAELNRGFLYVVPVLLSIGFSIGVLFLHGASHKRVRYLAYALFLWAVAALFGDNVLTILGSSGVLFSVSVLLAIIAFGLYRLEQRFNAAVKEGEADNE